jgi:signal transduction histidine kinase
MVSLTVAWTTIFGIGHFGDTGLSIDYRILQAQAIILVTTIGAYALAALFAERRKSELRLSHSNMLLERERDNKLMNAQAITAAIAHEIRQPLAAIMANAGAALRFLERAPPDHNEAQVALKRIKSDSKDASEVFDSFRTLFGNVDQRRQLINVNEIILEVLASFRGELQDHNVETHTELAHQLPLVNGHRNQLREVILNLVHNAVEAMDTTTGRNRVLSVKTVLRGQDAIIVSVKDSGPGIDPEQLNGIFGAFVTTKAQGTGLGLAICRMIIEHHDGQILASSDGKNGATIQFALPIGSTDKATARVKDTNR